MSLIKRVTCYKCVFVSKANAKFSAAINWTTVTLSSDDFEIIKIDASKYFVFREIIGKKRVAVVQLIATKRDVTE